MFTPEEYHEKAAAYGELIETAVTPEAASEYRRLQKSFTDLANNEQWLADHYHQTVHRTASSHSPPDDPGLAVEEEQILRCLGAALLMRWNTLPQKLRRELFDYAGAMGELSEVANLRGQIARFLHRHKDDDI